MFLFCHSLRKSCKSKEQAVYVRRFGLNSFEQLLHSYSIQRPVLMHLVFSLEKISSFPGACPPTFSNLFPSLVHTHLQQQSYFESKDSIFRGLLFGKIFLCFTVNIIFKSNKISKDKERVADRKKCNLYPTNKLSSLSLEIH